MLLMTQVKTSDFEKIHIADSIISRFKGLIAERIKEKHAILLYPAILFTCFLCASLLTHYTNENLTVVRTVKEYDPGG